MKKIFLTFKPFEGSYGGGMFFVKNLINYLQSKNFNITFKLEENIDLIFITDPRKGKYKKYSVDDIIKYKNEHPNVKIIHRVNDCDKKREKGNLDKLILKTIHLADKVIFISKWLKEYFFKKYKLNIDNCIILNGCNSKYFYPLSKKELSNKLKIVTHHWSNNLLKGFFIYNKIDEYLNNNSDFEFTFIGNYNKEYKPKNIKIITPKHGLELGNLLRKQDIYLTATQFEPCGMHHIEGMSCGLPLLYYKNGGAIKEAASNCSEEFSSFENMLEVIKKIKNNYDNYRNKINYEYLGNKRCCEQYFNEILNLFA